MQPKLADSIIIVAGCLTSPGRVRVGFRVAEVCVCLVLRASCLTAIIGRSRTIYTVYILYTYKIHRRCMYTYNVCGKNHIYTVYILYCWSLTSSLQLVAPTTCMMPTGVCKLTVISTTMLTTCFAHTSFPNNVILLTQYYDDNGIQFNRPEARMQRAAEIERATLTNSKYDSYCTSASWGFTAHNALKLRWTRHGYQGLLQQSA